MYLYFVHCGYFRSLSSSEVQDGSFPCESHQNFFIVAKDITSAKSHTRRLSAFQQWNMHIDRVQKIETVQGYHIVIRPVVIKPIYEKME